MFVHSSKIERHKTCQTYRIDFQLWGSNTSTAQGAMTNSRLKGACYVVKLNDGNLLIEVDCFETYSEALQQFNQTIELGSFGRWKELYLEGKDTAGQFVDIYRVHDFGKNKSD